MGTAPNGYNTPKTNWTAGNVPTASDFNRIEMNIKAVEEGQRTIDPAQVPASNQGSLRQFLDWFANRIRAITGKANWYDAPSKTLEDLNTHINAAAPHSGHETPAGAQAKAEAAAGAVRAELDAHKADYANPHHVKAEQVFALGGVPAGTTFPTSPAPYTLFFRTDLNKLFVYLP